MREQGLADNTVRKRCGVAKQVLKQAVRHKLFPENPFVDLESAIRGNRVRFKYVTREEIAAVISACPDADWRLLVALARFAGLRTPSESLSLKWQDIDWEKDRIRITSPKTEHHLGKGERWIPFFPVLKPFLQN